MLQEKIAVAVDRCQPLETKSLEGFLDGFLDEDLDVLAQMPGTPGQVMAAQFTHYVRSSVTLSECRRRETAQAQKLMETIMRLPMSRRRTTRRDAPDGSDSSHSQTVAA